MRAICAIVGGRGVPCARKYHMERGGVQSGQENYETRKTSSYRG